MQKLYFPILVLGFITWGSFDVQAGLDGPIGTGGASGQDHSEACKKGFNLCMRMCTDSEQKGGLNLEQDRCSLFCGNAGTECNGGEALKF